MVDPRSSATPSVTHTTRLDPGRRAQLETAARFLLAHQSLESSVGAVAVATRPLVLDANYLRGEVLRLARQPHDTVLVTLARAGIVALFVAPHVVEEVERHLPAWASNSHVDGSVARNSWETRLKPLIATVAFDRDYLTADERQRLDVLSQPPPDGDPDDVPTAIVAMMMSAPLLSKDRKVLTAVYGPNVDIDEHREYLARLQAGGQVLAVHHWTASAVLSTRLLFVVSAAAVRAVTARSSTAMLAGAGTAICLLAARRHASSEAAAAVRSVMAAISEVATFYVQARTTFDELRVPLLPDLESLAAKVGQVRQSLRSTVLTGHPVVQELARRSAWDASADVY